MRIKKMFAPYFYPNTDSKIALQVTNENSNSIRVCFCRSWLMHCEKWLNNQPLSPVSRVTVVDRFHCTYVRYRGYKSYDLYVHNVTLYTLTV